MNTLRKAVGLSAFLSAIALLAWVPGTGSAQELRVKVSDARIADRAQLKVGYDDLNLASASGARALYNRIDWAAGQVCGPMASNMELSRFAARAKCHDDAVSTAVRDVNHPNLTALHHKSTGKSATAMLAARRPLRK